MSLKQNLVIRPSTIMTQSLQESVKILQYSNQELGNYINSQLETNPFLFVIENETEKIIEDEPLERIEEDIFDQEINEYVSSALYDENSSYRENKKNDFDSELFLNFREREISLREHILEQVNLDITSNKEKIIATYLIEMLDISNGYIDLNYDYVIGLIKCSKKEIDNVLNKMQQFDPPGIFSRNLSECLKLQLMDRKIFNKDFSTLLENLDLIASMDLVKIKEKSGLSINEIKDYINIIKSLNPKPGNKFDAGFVQTIEPDLFLRDSEGEWKLEINNIFLPKVSVNKEYYKNAKLHTKEKVEKKDLSLFYQNANSLIKSVQHRSITLMRVAQKIVEKQSEFFVKGINYLKSLSLNEIATEVEISTSTVSRITSNKYISTPIGMFDLKYFFSTQLSNNSVNNTGESSKKVQYLIKYIIEHEQKGEHLSDQSIVNILREKEIEISRRTVNKYRKKMNIESSSLRKKKQKIVEMA